MKESIAKAWTTALRSGEYTQSKYYLKTNEGYCCLGVLCEILGYPFSYLKDQNINGTINTIYACGGDNNNNESEATVLPDTVKITAGLKRPSGVFVDNNGSQNSLACLNDIGKSFEEIADVIDNKWEEL